MEIRYVAHKLTKNKKKDLLLTVKMDFKEEDLRVYIIIIVQVILEEFL